MNFERNHFKGLNDYLPALLWAIAVVILYLPLLLKGGIIIDDWGGLASNFQCESIFNSCFKERYLDAFYAVFANRPLAPLPIVFSTVLFKTNFSGYLWLNTTIFLCSILIVARIINKVVGQLPALVFAYLAVIPFIAMPLVVSPVNLMDSTLAYLFWSISLYLIYEYRLKGSIWRYCISYLLLVLGFFTYEVFLPLLTLSALIPYIVGEKNQKISKFKYALKYVCPLLIVLAIVYSWQKIIGPNYFDFHSRLVFSWKNVVPSFLSWANVFLESAPALFLKSRKFLSVSLVLGSIFFVASLFFSCHLLMNRNDKKEKPLLAFFSIVALCLFASSFIFILSGAQAEIGGYEARAMSSTWICFALFCSGFSTVFLLRWSSLLKKVLGAICFAIIFFCSLSFGIQRNNYIESWKIQTFIIKDALSLIAQKDIENSATVIGNVPQYLKSNFNNELVFNTYWDFTAALRVFTNNLIKGGPVFDAGSGNFHQLRVVDGMLLIDNLKIKDFSNLWFYDYDSMRAKGTLSKISTIQELKQTLDSLGNPTYLGELGTGSAIERGEVLDFSREWINRHHFIKSGFAERERWGAWSSGNETELLLPFPANGAKGLILNVRAFIAPSVPSQKIEISVNGQNLPPVVLTKFDGNQIFIPISPQIQTKEKILQIHFRFPNAVSPKQAGVGADERVLAVGFEKAVFY